MLYDISGNRVTTPLPEDTIIRIIRFLKKKITDDNCWEDGGDCAAYDLLNEILLESIGREVV